MNKHVYPHMGLYKFDMATSGTLTCICVLSNVNSTVLLFVENAQPSLINEFPNFLSCQLTNIPPYCASPDTAVKKHGLPSCSKSYT